VEAEAVHVGDGQVRRAVGEAEVSPRLQTAAVREMEIHILGGTVLKTDACAVLNRSIGHLEDPLDGGAACATEPLVG
jgi:hypothetical protein